MKRAILLPVWDEEPLFFQHGDIKQLRERLPIVTATAMCNVIARTKHTRYVGMENGRFSTFEMVITLLLLRSDCQSKDAPILAPKDRCPRVDQGCCSVR